MEHTKDFYEVNIYFWMKNLSVTDMYSLSSISLGNKVVWLMDLAKISLVLRIFSLEAS